MIRDTTATGRHTNVAAWAAKQNAWPRALSGMALDDKYAGISDD